MGEKWTSDVSISTMYSRQNWWYRWYIHNMKHAHGLCFVLLFHGLYQSILTLSTQITGVEATQKSIGKESHETTNNWQSSKHLVVSVPVK